MKWDGIKIKELAKKNGISYQILADKVGVSRQTVNDWIKGQIPKGNHLLMLCSLFEVNPDVLFIENIDQYLKVPVHRTQRRIHITSEMQETAKTLANEYSWIFRNYNKSSVLPVIRTHGFDFEAAIEIADQLRSIPAISDNKPIDYQHTFELSEKLGITIIFRYFPDSLKGYAFYTQIHNHRVIFVNCFTNVLDLIFPLLHEFVHAIRDEEEKEYNRTEEEFCDLVACKVQFPDEYVEMVYKAIEGLKASLQINKLKEFARFNKHSIHGICKAIKYLDPQFTLSYGGADTNLKTEFPAIGEILFQHDDTRTFIQILKSLNNNFVKILTMQLDSISNRKLAELMGLEGSLDAKEIRAELIKSQALSNN